MNDSRPSWVVFSQVWYLHQLVLEVAKDSMPPPGSRFAYVFWTLFFSHCHRIKKPIPAAIQEAI